MRTIFRIFFTLLLSIVLVQACNSTERDEKPLAQVGDKSLYLSDIVDILGPDLTPEDSLAVLTNYATRWVRNQLVLRQAENNLSKQEKDVTSELESYRASLLIFRYEQAYLEQRIDTVVSAAEIKSFYEANSDNFQLTSLLVKALYIKVSNDSPFLNKMRELYRSNKDKDFAELEKMSVQGAVKFDAFSNEWVDFNVLSKEFPLDAQSYENNLIRKRYLDERDDKYTYLLNVKDLMMKGGVAPLEHVEANIKTLILNKRKIDMVNQLENKIYQEAVKRSDFKINIEQ